VRNFEVNEGEQVLDLCTGSGNVALHAGRRSRERIVAVDINPNAVESARRNLGLLKLDPYRCSYNVRCGDLFDAVSDDERFHVIMANVPFNIRRIVDNADRAFGDPDLSLHRRLFTGAQKHLRQGGRMYLANANFGTVDEMYALAGEHGFSMELIGRMRDPLMNFKVYYAFELKRE
jgi:release factor glutamine methyltransferase